MKLIRFGAIGAEKPGVLLNDRRVDCSGQFTDWDRTFFQGDGLTKLADLLAKSADDLPTVDKDARWGACVARPGKVVCIGLNYADHAAEAGMDVPSEPIIFLKAANTVVGPYDDVLIPRGSTKTDWEVELGFVLSQDARYVDSINAAKSYIAGYCISHDVSERGFQLACGGQWTKGKSCDTFNPLGPFLATADEITTPENLALTLSVNGDTRQTGSTKTMVFEVPFLLHYLSQFMTLEAGDVVTTGTPPGVGMGMKPPQYLVAGDVVELSIDGLGSQRQTFHDA